MARVAVSRDQVADVVEEATKRLGITHYRLAKLLGVHVVSVYRWKRGLVGMSEPTYERLQRLLAARGNPEQ